jgi:hypothetical protein
MSPSPAGEQYGIVWPGVEARLNCTRTVPLTRETPLSVIYRYAAGFGMFTACLLAGAVLLSPSRIITRLSQVRLRPASGSSALDTLGKGVGERSFVRLQHGGHLMSLGSGQKWREIPVEEIRVRMIRGGEWGGLSGLSGPMPCFEWSQASNRRKTRIM